MHSLHEAALPHAGRAGEADWSTEVIALVPTVVEAVKIFLWIDVVSGSMRSSHADKLLNQRCFLGRGDVKAGQVLPDFRVDKV